MKRKNSIKKALYFQKRLENSQTEDTESQQLKSDCQDDFENLIHLEDTLKQILNLVLLLSIIKMLVINVCPYFNALRNNATNSLGKLNFISIVHQTFKNSALQNTY